MVYDENNVPDHHTVRLHGETLLEVDEIRSPGQSWNGAIQEILNRVEELEEENEELKFKLKKLREEKN